MRIRIGGSKYRKGKPWKGRYVWLAMGILWVFWALWGFWSGTEAYQEELTQVDWPTTQATVTQVDRIREFSATRPSSRYYYDITYAYSVDGDVYTGFLEHQSAQASVGDTFQVKYNPQALEQSTDILEPTKEYILGNGILCMAGITLVVMSVRRKKPRPQEP